MAGECCVKLKDYEIPQYGLGDGPGQEDLGQYSLKNFDLKAYQLTQQQPDLAPVPAFVAAAPEAPALWSATPEPPIEQSFVPAPNPPQTEPNQPAADLFDVQFGAHFNLQTVSFTPLSPAQSWKLPRWVIMTAGLFFGSAALMMIVACVVLLRDPHPAPTAPLAVAAAPVVTTPVAPVQTRAPINKPAPAPQIAPKTANLIHDNSALPHRTVVSRHPTVVRRQSYGSRRVASKSPSSSEAPQETETVTRRPPKDALDQLLGESVL